MALEAESQALAEELSSFVDEVRNMLLDPLLVLKTITHG
jgi:type IV secretory pathway TrbF-like protein